jgi:3-oxoacyl-[acyl-carrier protein] reductase
MPREIEFSTHDVLAKAADVFTRHGYAGASLATLQQTQVLAGKGQPEHIAGVVAFLAGPDGAWTTGQVIDASGGTKL